MASITKQVGKKRTTYKVRIRKPNHPTVTKTFTSKSLAEKWARKTEREIEEDEYLEKKEASLHTLSDLVDRYLDEELRKLSEADWRIRTRQLNWWKRQLGDLTLNRITPPLLTEYRAKLLSEKDERGKVKSGSTVNRYMAAMSAAFGIAEKEWHWVKENPFTKVRRERESKGRVRFLDAGERDALLDACKNSSNQLLYPITVLALSTGMRQSEIMTLRWDQIDIERSSITLHNTKNNETRVVPLVGLAAKLLTSHGQIRRIDNPFVFSGRDDSHTEFPRKAWMTAVKKAKINDFTFHDCRHSAASELAMNGASLHEIAAVLGHKTLAMVQRYAHLSEQHTASVVERMNKAVFGDVGEAQT